MYFSYFHFVILLHRYRYIIFFLKPASKFTLIKFSQVFGFRAISVHNIFTKLFLFIPNLLSWLMDVFKIEVFHKVYFILLFSLWILTAFFEPGLNLV